jgi:hypothetical protein
MFRGVCLLLMLIACADYIFMGGAHVDAAQKIGASILHFFSGR